MVVTVLIVASLGAAYAALMTWLLRRWRESAPSEPVARPVRTSIDHDPDNRYPFMSGDSF